jgi:hypothetical protein
VTAQVRKVSVLGADDVAPVAGGGVGIAPAVTLIADAGHNGRCGVLLGPQEVRGAEANEDGEEGSLSSAVHVGMSISAALTRQIYGR